MTVNRARAAGLTYLERFTRGDLRLLARSDASTGDLGAAVGRLRAQPEHVDERLHDSAVFQAVFGARDRPPGGAGGDPLAHASPAMVFALAVASAEQALRDAASVREWAGPRQRIPVLSTGDLREVVADPLRRAFLAELLTSFTRVASGSVWVQTRRGPRRRRFSDLDPVRLASLLDALPEQQHAGVYRRLGDLALFLTGVFPDATATRTFRPVEVAQLAHAAGSTRPGQAVEQFADVVAARGAVGLLELLGARWYALAVRQADQPASQTASVLSEVADRFEPARRALNYITDRWLFPFRGQWFPPERASA